MYALQRVLARRSDNVRAKHLLACALYRGGRYDDLTTRFRDEIARGDGSPYLLTVVARGFEALGEREQAGALLDRAALPPAAALRVVPDRTRIGALLALGRSADALAAAEGARAANPGNYDYQSLAGDVQLALGDAAAAQVRYVAAAQIPMSESLLLRRYQAYAAVRDGTGAAQMVEGYLAQNTNSRTGLRLAASLSVQNGDPRRAVAILGYLRRTGSENDVQLLSDLALVQVAIGGSKTAADNAGTAYGLQRANPLAAQALGLSYVGQGVGRGQAGALLDEARLMLGDNPLIAAAREKLARLGQFFG